MCFAFRRARSHPLAPDMTGRFLPGRSGNVHARMSVCQGELHPQQANKKSSDQQPTMLHWRQNHRLSAETVSLRRGTT